MPSSKKKNRAKKKKEKAAAIAMNGKIHMETAEAAEAAHDVEITTAAPPSSSETHGDDGNSGDGADGASSAAGNGVAEAASGGCVELGFAQKLTAEELEQPALHDDPDWKNWDGGKIGGQPSWLSPLLPPPSKLTCINCGGRESLLAQVYAPVDCDDGRAFHRSLYIFCCANPSCGPQHKQVNGRHVGVHAFRCQLPRDNPYYSHDAESAFGLEGEAKAKARAEALAEADAAQAESAAAASTAAAAEAGAGGGAECGVAASMSGRSGAAQPPAAPTLADGDGAEAGAGPASMSNSVACFEEYDLVIETEPSGEGDNDGDEGVDVHTHTGNGGGSGNIVTGPQDASGDKAAVAAAAVEMAKLGLDMPTISAALQADDGFGGDDGTTGPTQAQLNAILRGEDVDLTTRGEDGVGDDDAGGDDDDGVDDPVTLGFMQRIAVEPSQCVRYGRWGEGGTRPLWVASGCRPTAADVPPCDRCGAERRFELQLMPQILHYAGNAVCHPCHPTATATDESGAVAGAASTTAGAGDIDKSMGIDFGTIAIYTCTNSCGGQRLVDGSQCEGDIENGAYAEEFVWVQPHSQQSVLSRMPKET
eukprot:g1143.t1